MKTQLTFLFESTKEAADFLAKVNGASAGATKATPAEVLPAVNEAAAAAFEPAPTVTPHPQDQGSTAAPAAAISKDADNELATPAGGKKKGGKITAKMVSDALRDFKHSCGYPKYKELLAYFGVSTVRDIPKSEYQNVLDLVAKSTGPGAIPQKAESTETATEAPTTPGNVVPLSDTSKASPEDLRRALGEHKAKWGLEATKAVLARVGYPDPNTIPDTEYPRVMDELANDDPTAADDKDGLGFDLTDF